MNCAELGTFLHPYLDGELLEGDRVSLEGHLATCDVCARRAEAERHNHSVVRTRAAEGTPRSPQGLRERVFQAVRAEDQRRVRRRWAQAAAAAAGLTLVSFLGHQEYRAFQRRLYVEDAARRHARQFPLEIERNSSEALEAWFGGKLPHRVAVPQLVNATATGARLLQVRDKEAAYFRLELRGQEASRALRHVGLFVYGDASNDVDVGRLAEPNLGRSLGYNVVSWRDGDVVYQMVTDLDEDDIRDLLAGGAQRPHPAPSVQPEPRSLDLLPASLRR